MLPLPKGAAFEDLALSINGEMVTGETMNAERARGVYEEIVRKLARSRARRVDGPRLAAHANLPDSAGRGKARRRPVPRDRRTRRRRAAPRLARRSPRGRRRRQHVRSRSAIQTTRRSATAYSPTHSLQTTHEQSRRVARIDDARGPVTVLVPVRSRVDRRDFAARERAERRRRLRADHALAAGAVGARATPRDIVLVIDVSGSMSGQKDRAGARGRTAAAADAHAVGSFPPDRFLQRRAHVPRWMDRCDGRQCQRGARLSRRDCARMAARTSRARSTKRWRPIRLKAACRSCSFLRMARRRSVKRVPTRSCSTPAICAASAASSPSASAPTSTQRCWNSSRCRDAAPQRSCGRKNPSSAPWAWSPTGSRVRSRRTCTSSVDGVRLYGLQPQGAIDLFAGQDLVVLARYSGNREDATLVIEGRTSDGPVRWTGHVSFPAHTTENAFVARLWAAQRVGYLSAERHRTRRQRRARRRTSPARRTLRHSDRAHVVSRDRARHATGNAARAAAFASRRCRDAPGRELRERAGGRAVRSRENGIRTARGDYRSAISTRTRRAKKRNRRAMAGNRTFTLQDSVWTETRTATGIAGDQGEGILAGVLCARAERAGTRAAVRDRRTRARVRPAGRDRSRAGWTHAARRGGARRRGQELVANHSARRRTSLP